MTPTPSENQSSNLVSLAEDEFKEVYALMKMCIAAEMGIDEEQVPDGEPFIKSCRKILSTGKPESTKYFDMSKGFVPLFERLSDAKNAPVKTQDGTFYQVEF